MLLAHAPILRHVAPRLTHQPNGSVWRRLAPAGPHERMVVQLARGPRRLNNRNFGRLIGDANRVERPAITRRCPFAREYRGSARGGRFHQMSELRMLGLDIDADA